MGYWVLIALPGAVALIGMWDAVVGALATAIILVPSLAAADAFGDRRKSSLASAAVATLICAAIIALIMWPFIFTVQIFIASSDLPEAYSVVIGLLSAGVLFGVMAGLASWLALRPICGLGYFLATRIASSGALAGVVVLADRPALGGVAAVLGFLAFRLPKWVAVMSVAIVFGGCAVTAENAPAGAHSWREGWADGCNFSRGMSGGGNAWTVDITRRQQDRLYSQGLSDGARWCE